MITNIVGLDILRMKKHHLKLRQNAVSFFDIYLYYCSYWLLLDKYEEKNRKTLLVGFQIPQLVFYDRNLKQLMSVGHNHNHQKNKD